ncbi:MAG TPA: TolC family protein [Gemmataceae bacterium]|jgi:outer membrane protein TolC
MPIRPAARRSLSFLAAALACGPLAALAQDRFDKAAPPTLPPPTPVPGEPPPTLLDPRSEPVSLGAALRAAGVGNPEILIARERVTEAVALRQLAAAQILPNLNAGTNVEVHTGTLQQSTGNILKVNRGSLYLGLGANAVGAGTVGIPGIAWAGNLDEAIFTALIRRQVVRERQLTAAAVTNDTLLRVAVGYVELLRAEGRRALAVRSRDEAAEVARVTADFARVGQGRQADADRAATELRQRTLALEQSEADVLTASARLAQLLSLDPSLRLHATDGWVVPAPIVPDPIPLCELIAIAITRRPELAERRVVIQEALLELRGAKLLPFAPTILLGYSAGTFGGGSNLAAAGIPQANGTVLRQPRFDSFDGRQDVDAVAFWTTRNLGVGNLALVRVSQSHVRASNLRFTEVLDRVRAEVATAYARTHARYAQIETAEQAVRTGQRAFEEDLRRTRNQEGLPIEVLDSLRLLDRSREAYLDAIIDYNRAQFELYVALGQPPADTLARPVPAELVPPPAEAPPCPPAPPPP